MSGFFEWRNAPRADFAVIGDPVLHSLSPKMMSAAFDAMALPLAYVALRVVPGEVSTALEYLSSIGYRGINVTVPHKEEAWQWLEESDAFSNRVRAANVIDLLGRRGINTDGTGFADTLAELDFEPPRTAIVLGAGGSARAICLALSESGFNLRVWNRTGSRAKEMLATLGIEAEVLTEATLSGTDLIVNATSASLLGGGLTLDWPSAPKRAIAYDLTYGDTTSRFLQGAAQHGLKTVDGIPLLVAQGARSLEWWIGAVAPREAMLKALR